MVVQTDVRDAASCYRVVGSRDRRFDGVFVAAVRSTGIYCRPSCPARTPKPGNVTFHRTAAAAQAAGYRFLASDASARRVLRSLDPGLAAGVPDVAAVEEAARRWRPWRSYALPHLCTRLLAEEAGR